MLKQMYQCDLCEAVEAAPPRVSQAESCDEEWPLPAGWIQAIVALGPNRSFEGEVCEKCARTLRTRIAHYESYSHDNSPTWKRNPFEDPPVAMPAKEEL